MPNRIIKESCRTSPDLAKLGHGAERFFWRLTTGTDDQGRFDATPKVLLGACFPLLIGRISERDIRAWLLEMEQAGLIVLYTVSGRDYGFFRNWAQHQRVYGRWSKYPDPELAVSPESAGSCGDSPESAGNPCSYPVIGNRESVSGNRYSVIGNRESVIAHLGVTGFGKFWALYPRKKSKGKAESSWAKLKPTEQLQDRIFDALERAKTSADWLKEGGQFIPYPASWLNAKGWEDESSPPTLTSPQTEGIHAFVGREIP